MQMKVVYLLLVFVWSLAFSNAEELKIQEKDWASVFDEYGIDGTIVLYDARVENLSLSAYNSKRAKKRFSPASTFKIVHSLFAIDAGLVGDAKEVFKWDGQRRAVKAWNQDQTLRMAVQNSTVWVFEGFANSLGNQKELEYLQKISYGNCKTGKKPFWIAGDLAISAVEQIQILEALYKEELPFELSDQQLVKSILELKSNSNFKLRGKTGWNGKLAWFVGWAETEKGPLFFALNINTPNKKKDLPAREAIVSKILGLHGISLDSD